MASSGCAEVVTGLQYSYVGPIGLFSVCSLMRFHFKTRPDTGITDMHPSIGFSLCWIWAYSRQHRAALPPLLSFDRRVAKLWSEQRCEERKYEASPEGKARERGLSFMSHGSALIEPESSPISHAD